MSNVNGDDIDYIFRRASEKYPLRIDGANWNKLAADLESDPSLILTAQNAEGDERRKKRFFWLFLLLPLGGLGYYAMQVTGHGAARQPAVVSSPSSTAVIPNSNANNTNAASGTTTAAPSTTTPAVDPGLLTTRSTNPNAGRSFHSGADQSARSVAQSAARVAQPATDAAQRGTDAAQQATASATQPADAQLNEPNAPARDPRHFDPFTLQRARTSSGIALNVNVQPRHTPNVAPAPTKLAKPRQSSFYVGLLFAADLSTVKFQSVKGVGNSFGVLLGYNINRNWAIETGVSLDRKKYYTQGEYFSTKNITIPPNVKISNVDGYCDMWEIPLNVRYNFGREEKVKWFATAGLSTYIMTNEHYTYQYESRIGGNRWPDSKKYNTQANYLFSIINLSMGYEQHLGKVGNLRLEPYLRVPLAGLGTGSLPIMSAGLNIGITRRIW